jgi:hypothetical protein
MMEKEDYVSLIKEIRVMLASDKEAECSCPKTKCERHGDCYNCIRIHRHFGDHVPNCLQFILQGRVKEIAHVAGLIVQKKPMTPDEYWDYVNSVAPLGEKSRKTREVLHGRKP